MVLYAIARELELDLTMRRVRACDHAFIEWYREREKENERVRDQRAQQRKGRHR
jgi:hypothetical protein